MTRIAIFVAAALLVLSMATPAFAVDGSSGTGLEFGTHHATHAQEMTGFTVDMNPGTHTGFAGWTGM